MIRHDEEMLKTVTSKVRNIPWRDWKFLVNDDQLLEVAEDVMVVIPSVKAKCLADPNTREDNVKAFCTTHGNSILKTLNQKQTEPQSTIKRAHDKRHRAGKPMPSPAQILEVILLKNMLPRGTKDSRELVMEECAAMNQELFLLCWDRLLIGVWFHLLVPLS